MSAMAAQISGVSSIYSTVRWSANQRKHQSSPSLAFVRGIHRWPVNSPHKGPVTWKMFPFDDVIMTTLEQENPWALDTLGNLRRHWQTCADTARGWNDLCSMSLATTPHVEYWPYFNKNWWFASLKWVIVPFIYSVNARTDIASPCQLGHGTLTILLL